MRRLLIKCHNITCGVLEEATPSGPYLFTYDENYSGPAISLTMPIQRAPYEFKGFPPFFDGLLPEGVQLEALLRHKKIDRKDYMKQLATVGEDMVGAVTAFPVEGDF